MGTANAKRIAGAVAKSADQDAVAIGKEINLSKASIVDSMRHLHAAGTMLRAKKESLAHGEWLRWLEDKYSVLGFSNRGTAQRLIEISNVALAPHLTEDEAIELRRKVWRHKPAPKLSATPTRLPVRKIITRDWGDDEEEDDDPGDDAETIWRRSLMNRSIMACGYAEYEDWDEFEADDELIAQVNGAAQMWAKVAEHVQRMKRRVR